MEVLVRMEPLSPEQIDKEEAALKARSSVAEGFKEKVVFRYMDTVYIRALRRGETPNEARETAAERIGVARGALFGVLATLVLASAVSWIWGTYRVLNTIEATVVVSVWIVVIILCVGHVRRWLKAKIKARWAKRKARTKGS